MKRMSFILLVLYAIFLPPPAHAYQKGMVLGLYNRAPRSSYEQDLKEIRKLGADHVSLVVSWFQKDIRANEIYPRWQPVGDYETTADEKIEEVVQQAHRAGLKVFLFPILRIEERKDKEWRGVLAPQNQKQWLESYRRFTLHYARMAAKNGVELFSVGSELCSMEKETDYWKKLISEIREFYRGELLYSANWDHYKTIPFWDDLDYLGLNGYYELTSIDTPTIEELLRKWWDIGNDLANWQEQHRKKIIFTEIGYPSIDGACRKPWDYTRNTPIDLDEQALCYEAFFLSWAKSQKLGGVYFWNWYGQGGENDRSYTPRGKPAEKVLTRWYQDNTPPYSQPLSSDSGGSGAVARPKRNSGATSSGAPSPSL